jgi:predicted histone-like DNA-binding protein
MSIKFHVVERGRPGHPETPKKYYPYLKSSGRVSVRELAEEASDRSTLTTADMMAAIETFLSIIPKHLADGKIVELGDFGNFGLRFNANGAETPGEVRGELVRTLLPHFRPGKEFKKVLRTAKIQKSHRPVE